MKTVLRNSYSPKIGDYCDTLVVDLEKNNKYLFDCDGVWTAVSGGITPEVEEAIAEAKAEANDYTDTEVGIEKDAREAADNAIWTEIETIEASSDVVDVVGTHAELEQYDTSKLHDKDLIKVLADETRDDAITYYRWSTTTETFTYVGAEGPYYTASETDTLLSGKQDTLIAGTNIQIAADGKTISATDTTYTHFTGATASTDGVQGLVPGPLAGDEDKYLKADGTWSTVQSGTTGVVLYPKWNGGTFEGLFRDQQFTDEVYGYELVDMLKDTTVLIDDGVLYEGLFKLSWAYDGDEGVHSFIGYGYVNHGSLGCIHIHIPSYTGGSSGYSYDYIPLQNKLTAGTNIQINGNTISATDTTYSDFTGASSVAGVHGLVPAPSVGDDEKYLKGDGTWDYLNVVTEFRWANGGIEKSSGEPATDIDVSRGMRYGKAVIVDVVPGNNSVMGEFVAETSRSSVVTEFTVLEPGDTVGEATVVKFTYDGSNAVWTKDIIGLQSTLTAGSNITISGSTISATNTTYSPFNGATAQLDGSAGLVPQPLIADRDKYLKGDGTWATVQAGPTVVQTIGQSTTDVMSQKAVTDIIGNIESALQILNSGAGVP